MSVKMYAGSKIILRVQCRRCETITRHAVLSQAVQHSNNEDFNRTDYYEIVQCQGCEDVSFRRNYHDSDDVIREEVYPGKYEERLIDHEQFFPPRLTDHKALVDSYKLPRRLRKIYDETLFALSNKQHILAGIGIRAIIELVCQTESATGRDLNMKIEALVNAGKLTKDNGKFLHQTRLMGNRSAHEVEATEEYVLISCWKIAEHLLYTLYILPTIAGEGQAPICDAP